MMPRRRALATSRPSAARCVVSRAAVLQHTGCDRLRRRRRVPGSCLRRPGLQGSGWADAPSHSVYRRAALIARSLAHPRHSSGHRRPAPIPSSVRARRHPVPPIGSDLGRCGPGRRTSRLPDLQIDARGPRRCPALLPPALHRYVRRGPARAVSTSSAPLRPPGARPGFAQPRCRQLCAATSAGGPARAVACGRQSGAPKSSCGPPDVAGRGVHRVSL